MSTSIVNRLLESSEPSVRYRVMTRVMRRSPESDIARRTQQEIARSPRVRRLLSEQQADGRIPHHPYSKWDGAHWVLALLADLGYPPGDERLIPLREQVYKWLLSKAHLRSVRPLLERNRVCASKEGNALHALFTLGIADERADILAAHLLGWQWPDGGWNCDKNPAADHSSFMETLLPLRGLALHARLTGSDRSRRAAEAASEVFLKRRLFKRQHDGRVMRSEFIELHYPCYWHYDILFGLKVMAEAGWIRVKRCADALDLLESRRLPDGGFAAERKYYHLGAARKTGRSLVDWGGAGAGRMNEFVTADALVVLAAAGRLRADGAAASSAVSMP